MSSENKKEKVYKEKSALVITEEFFVSHVLSESQISQITIDLAERDEWESPIINGKPFDDIYGDYKLSEEYNGGLITRYILDVKPKNKKLPIKKLYFEGSNLPLIGGTYIKAKIFKGEFDRERQFKFGDLSQKKTITSWFERNYHDEESALEITLYKDDSPIYSARSIKYKDFFKDSLF